MKDQLLPNIEDTPIENKLLPDSLPADLLRRQCDPDSLEFQNTDELPDLVNVIGQPRALRAIEIGSEVSGPGYNIFVLGLPSSGRTTLTHEFLLRKASKEPTPDDWCYVNNFDNPHKPIALRLPAGFGVKLREDIHTIVTHCEIEIPRAFEMEEYIRERDHLISELKKSQEVEFLRLQEYVEKYNFILIRSPVGFALLPAVKGKPLKAEEIQNLPEEQRAKLQELQVKLSEEVENTINRLRNMGKETTEALDELNRQTALFVIRPMIDELKSKYIEFVVVTEYLEAIQADISANVTRMKSQETEGGSSPGINTQRYDINVLVDNSECHGAPVIIENHPSYYNLLGRIEHTVVMGATRTDFTMIRAGAFHRANGGYLIISTRDLLVSPYAWEGVKRIFRAGAIQIIEIGSQLGLLSTETLEPEPIPLSLKIILVGTPILYYLLRAYDDDFAKHFKIKAEFTTLMDRDAESEMEFSQFVKSVLIENNLPSFENSAIAVLIEHSSRMAGDQQKLSTRFGLVADIIREAAYWAEKEGKSNGEQIIVSANAVNTALQENIYRNNLIEERIQELISQGTILIKITGSAIGQVNALSVISLGDYSFGRPCRVTASAYPGKAGVIDVERQAKLSGPIHTKGIMIISGLLSQRYGQRKPLSLSARLVFEQSYEEVEGDSASAAELYALLSAIANIPIRQDIAVTGSINQYGEIQAVGGVNEKIEGFYYLCNKCGLTGNQGVIIPTYNIRNLMLHKEVIEAVKSGVFHIYSISKIDEGLEILTGLMSGNPVKDGTYPVGTLNHLIELRLEQYAHIVETSSQEHQVVNTEHDIDETYPR